MKFDRLLVTTDLSEVSRAACVHAADLGQRLGAPITFLFVDELARVGLEAGEEDLAEFVAHADEARRAGAEALRGALAAQGLPEPHLVVIPGHAAEAVVDYAVKHAFPLIVAARRSRATLDEHLLGSTARKLLRDAPMPVLILPARGDAPPAAPRAAELGPVLAPTDLHATSLAGVRVARELASALGATLLAVNVVDFPSVTDLMVTAPNELLTRVSRRIKLRAVESLRAHLQPLGLADREQRVINGPSPAEAVSALADHLEASLVVLPATTKGVLARFFLGSTSTRLVKIAKRPVLVMPERWLVGAP